MSETYPTNAENCNVQSQINCRALFKFIKWSKYSKSSAQENMRSSATVPPHLYNGVEIFFIHVHVTVFSITRAGQKVHLKFNFSWYHKENMKIITSDSFLLFADAEKALHTLLSKIQDLFINHWNFYPRKSTD